MVRDIEFAFRELTPDSVHETIDQAHGRIEKRTAAVLYHPKMLRKHEVWDNLQSIIVVKSEVTIAGKTEFSTTHYISSLNTNAEHIMSVIRSHWGIENNLHWMLDVAFNEDGSRKMNQNAVINFSLINKIALEMLKRESSVKIGVKSRRMKAGWGVGYLEKILGI